MMMMMKHHQAFICSSFSLAKADWLSAGCDKCPNKRFEWVLGDCLQGMNEGGDDAEEDNEDKDKHHDDLMVIIIF